MKELIELITLASMGFGISLAVKLMLLKKHGMVAMWLGFYVILLVGSLCEIFLPEGSIILTFLGAGYWLIGPCLYLYVSSRLQKVVPMRSAILHLVPFAMYAIAILVTAALNIKTRMDIVDLLLYESVFVHILVYMVLALMLILRTKKLRPVKEQLQAIQLASMQLIAILSIALFGISWTTTNIIAFAALDADSASYQLCVQGAVTLVIFSIALLNTETRYAESFE